MGAPPSRSSSWLLSLFIAGAVAGSTSCAASPTNQRGRYQQPSFDDYKRSVDGLLAKRCASLDCHGQAGRGLRLYSGRGFRRIEPPEIVDVNDPVFDPETSDASAYAGSGGPTPEELRDNYASIVGLEPELLSRVIRADGAGAKQLLVIRKAEDAERHQGGAVFKIGDPGEACLLSWIFGELDAAACRTASNGPGPSPAAP